MQHRLHHGEFVQIRVEQTGDDFIIIRGNGVVAYTKPTSEEAIKIDDTKQTTGYN
jgi:hypothetical protein